MLFYKKIIRLGQKICLPLNSISPIRWLGASLYKLSLQKILSTIESELPETISIYTTTKFDSSFVIGKSDIDLLLILKNANTRYDNILFKKIKNIRTNIEQKFPFCAIDLIFLDDFKLWEDLSHTLINKSPIKHLSGMILLSGQEIRSEFNDNDTALYGYRLRVYFEQILADIYYCKLKNKNYYRNLFKYSLSIFRIFFILKNTREPSNNQEYIDFLITQGINKDFINDFFQLPEKKFKTNEDFSIQSLYWMIKTIEMIAATDAKGADSEMTMIDSFKKPPEPLDDVREFIQGINKNNIGSIYYTSSTFEIKSDIIYIILKNNIEYNNFKEQIKSVLDNISKLRILDSKIEISYRLNMYASPPDIFPVIITEKLLNFTDFFNCSTHFEAINFNLNGAKLFGAEIKAGVDFSNFKKIFFIDNPNYIQTDKHFNRLEAISFMMYKLFAKTNTIYINDVWEKYQAFFGPIRYDLNTDEGSYLFLNNLIKECYELSRT